MTGEYPKPPDLTSWTVIPEGVEVIPRDTPYAYYSVETDSWLYHQNGVDADRIVRPVYTYYVEKPFWPTPLREDDKQDRIHLCLSDGTERRIIWNSAQCTWVRLGPVVRYYPNLAAIHNSYKKSWEIQFDKE